MSQVDRDVLAKKLNLEFAYNNRTKRPYVRSFELLAASGRNILKGTSLPNGKIARWQTENGSASKEFGVILRHFLPTFLLSASFPRRMPKAFERLFDTVFNFGNALEHCLQRLVYMGPIRIPIAPTYKVRGESSSNVGYRGENLLSVLFRDERKPKKQRGLLSQLNKWLDAKFRFVKNIRFEPIICPNKRASKTTTAQNGT